MQQIQHSRYQGQRRQLCLYLHLCPDFRLLLHLHLRRQYITVKPGRFRTHLLVSFLVFLSFLFCRKGSSSDAYTWRGGRLRTHLLVSFLGLCSFLSLPKASSACHWEWIPMRGIGMRIHGLASMGSSQRVFRIESGGSVQGKPAREAGKVGS
jgi:hypothetical protein